MRHSNHLKTGVCALFWIAAVITGAYAQSSAGVQWLPKIGLGISRNFMVDVGFVGYSYIPDKNKAKYYDANIGVMTLIGRHTMVMPKLDLNAGFLPLDSDDLFTLNAGADVGLLTDFKKSAIVLSPKAGLSAAMGLFRLYYHYNILFEEYRLYPGLGRHAVTLELNISILQGKGLKVM